jgi:hypothetical protein
MVTASVPVEVRVSVWVPREFSDTLPNATIAVLALRTPLAAFSCSVKEPDDPFAVAVRIAACGVVTAAAVAVNPALTPPLGTVTFPGSVTAALLLASATARPLAGAAELRLTVQLSVPDPVIVWLPQAIPLTVGVVDDPPDPPPPPAPPPPPDPPPPPELPLPEPELTAPVPLSPMTRVLPDVASVVIVSCPAIFPALAGSNCTFITMTCPGLRAKGKASLAILKPAPVSEAESIVTGSVPDEVRTTDCAAIVFVAT